MSRREIISVTCPQCGEEHPFTIWPSINTVLDPDMKDKVRDLSAFEFVCPTCGKKTKVAYDFLYHQMEDRLKIFCSISESDYNLLQEMFNTENFLKHLDDNPMKEVGNEMFNMDNTRIVRDYNQFLEKLNIFDDKLDDRIVEFIKIMALMKFYEDFPESFKYENIAIFYVPSEDEYMNFEIYGNGKIITGMKLPKDIYDEFYELYHEYLEIPELGSFEINLDWAASTQKLINELLEENTPEDD